MINAYHAKVQQKLSHCNLLLGILQSPHELGRQGEEALLQASVMHLAIAMRLYFRELASYSEVRQPETIYSLSDLKEKLPSNSQLQDISHYPWIEDLMAAERQILSPVLDNSHSQVIAISSGSETNRKIDFTVKSVRQWLSQFQRLSEQHLATLVEY